MTLAVRMGVIPEQSGRMIARNLDGIVQHLAGHGEHSEHVILRSVWRDGEPMKMQVGHVHARIQRANLTGLGRKIIDVSDFENLTRRSTDHRSDYLTAKSESIQAILVHRMQSQ